MVSSHSDLTAER